MEPGVEPAERLEEALSIAVVIDPSLESRWSIHNDRIEATEADPPSIRFKNARQMAINLLGRFAERHLGWG
jgi:putative ATP-dependent endonuclease of the OLD family